MSKIAELLVPEELEQEQGTRNTDSLLPKLGTRNQSWGEFQPQQRSWERDRVRGTGGREGCQRVLGVGGRVRGPGNGVRLRWEQRAE